MSRMFRITSTRTTSILTSVSLATLILVGCSGEPASSSLPTASPVEPAASASSPPENSTLESPLESPIAQSAPATAQVLRSGQFASGEHPTAGTAQLIQQDGGVVLQLDDTFQTSTLGPDLVVILHRSTNVLGETEPPAYPINEGDYVLLGELQAYSGTQSYTIPADINLAEYPSAAIWCRRFNATFGAALLQ